MLAMVVDDDAGCLINRSALRCFASMLAPTVDPYRTQICCGSEPARESGQPDLSEPDAGLYEERARRPDIHA
ncbi:hypothetical protein CES87_26595 [Pseudomonas sp. ERMR1:02]|nr:hypothetical protein CES87_26595 [Pseudomonas sp. ERMR1:02]